MTEWIRIKDQPPAVGEYVLVFGKLLDDTVVMTVAAYQPDGREDQWCWALDKAVELIGYDAAPSFVPTFWMPLPEAPE